MSNKVPLTCLKEIHKIQRNFIWGHTENERQVHTISWKEITQPKHCGGLRLRNLRDINSACIAKLGWKNKSEGRFLMENFMCGAYDRK